MTAELPSPAAPPSRGRERKPPPFGRRRDLPLLVEWVLRSPRLAMAIRTAVAGVRRWPLRSTLTVSGIVIGVASVLLIAALGEAARISAERGLRAMGSHMLILMAVPDASGGRQVGDLRLSDVRVLERRFPQVRRVVPQIQLPAVLVAPGRSWRTQVTGAPPSFQAMTDARAAAGRLLDGGDERRAARVAVLGSEVARRLFGGRTAVGEAVRINGVVFTVVGVLRSRGQSLVGNPDDRVLVPLSTAMRFLRRGAVRPDAVDVIDLQFDEGTDLEAKGKAVRAFLLERKHVREDEVAPFTIVSTEDFARGAQGIIRSFQSGLVAIAAISLFVGSVGIANIMLVSVTERTREIGLRLALGARPRDIRRQFLVEAGILSLGGAVLGLMIAELVAWGLRAAAGLEAVITPGWILIGVGFALLSGLSAGTWPARRAAALTPSDALRHE